MNEPNVLTLELLKWIKTYRTSYVLTNGMSTVRMIQKHQLKCYLRTDWGWTQEELRPQINHIDGGRRTPSKTTKVELVLNSDHMLNHKLLLG